MPLPMVGRVPALEELRRAWAQVQDGGHGRPAVVTGLPGTGKSTLIAAALQATRPARVLAGSARVHSPAPYDWLAAVLAGHGRTRVRTPPDALSWLAQDPDVPRERYTPEALLRLAVTTVRDLIAGGPAVLVIEDLHALDPASLNLIAELAAARLPALMLVTSRPADAAISPRLTASTLARLSGAPGAVRLHLGALAADEVGQLLTHVYPGCAVGSELAAAVWRRTGGNPYQLTELLAVEGADGPEALAGDPATPPAQRTGGPDDLTAREREVLGCLAEGMSNKRIAQSLGISVRTVTVHVSNVLRKTGAASRTEAALRAVRRDISAAAR